MSRMKIWSGPKKLGKCLEYILEEEGEKKLRYVRMHEDEIWTSKGRRRGRRLVPGGQLYRRIKAACAEERA